jgi:hypothetical protein
MVKLFHGSGMDDGPGCRWRGMTMPEDTPQAGLHPATALPDEIAGTLHRIMLRHRRMNIIGASLKAILVSLLVFLVVVLIIGGSPTMPLALRWILVISAWTAMIAATVWLLRPALDEVNLQSAASLVERSEPEHEERIISAVEFAENPPPIEHASPEMVQRVMEQAGEHTARINMAAVVSTKQVTRWMAYCLPAVLAWLILWPLFPQTVTTGVRRMFVPWSTAAGSSPAIKVSPGDVTLGQGAGLEIIGKAKPPLGGKPARTMTLAMTNTAGAKRLVTMTRIGENQFRASLADVESTFQYQLHTGNAQSPWYHANVIARPRISELELRYTYPAYTGLTARSVAGKDGAIKAVIGTQVQIIVHASEPLAPRSSVAMHTPIAGVLQHLPLTPLTGLEYQATFPIQYSSSYRIDLLNAQGIKNNDNRRWPIVAVADQPPVIHVLQPARRIRVRVDDVVPIVFKASDTYGLSGVQAVVTVDQSTAMDYRVDLGAKNPRQVRQEWKLSVADQLEAADHPHARAIYYRLEAIDNCEPTHQKTRTSVHELIIDRHLRQSYQQRRNMEAFRALNKALTNARNNIRRDQQRISGLQQVTANRRFSANQQRMAAAVQQNLAQTVENMKAAATAAKHSAFSPNANKASAEAQQALPKAANHVAAATFSNSHQARQRTANLAAAQQTLQHTRQALGQLQRHLAQQAGQQELADNLKTLAKQQKTLAKQLAQQPDSPSVQRRQQQLKKQLTQLLKKNQILQTPVAAKVQPTMATLKNQLGKIISAQQNAGETLQQQLRARTARQQLGQLAVKQQNLNQRVQQLEDSAESAGHAQNHWPNSPIMKSVVSNLRQHAARAALAGQHTISESLTDTAKQLNHAAQTPSTQSRQAQAQRQAMTNQRRLSEATQQTGGQNNLTARQQLQAAQHAASRMNRLAQKMLNEKPTIPEAAELNAAMAQAQQAMQAAADQNVSQAQASLQRAEHLMSQAVQQQLASTHAQRGLANPAQLRQWANQAAQLAQQQQQLAAQTRQLLAQKSAPPANATQQAQTARQIAAEIKQAAALAKTLETQTQSGAPSLNSDLAQARRQMQAGAQAQQSSAQALAKANTVAAQEHQQSAQQHIRIAMDDLNGALHSPEMRNVPQYNNMIAGQIPQRQNPTGKSAHGQSGQAPGSQSQSQSRSAGTGQSNYQRLMAAAQQVQQAMQAQQQAGEGNLQAAQQAADSLGAAGNTINPQGGGSGPSGTDAPGTALAMGQQSGHVGAGGGPGTTGTGISAQPSGVIGPGGLAGTPPKPVLAMGISPAQWSNLGPLAKRQLLNTARQNIPAGYKRMVRDYYIQLSEMRSQ